MKKLSLAVWLALFALPLALAGPAYANDCDEARTVFGNSFTLGSGETLDGNLVVLGGNATIESGATVNCDVVVLGGNVDIAGSVEEDVAVFGGNVDLRSTAVINGKLSTIGGGVSREEGAQVKGGESQGFGGSPYDDSGFGVPDRLWFVRPIFRFYANVLNTFLISSGLGLLALVVVLFWPDQTARVSAAITTAPGASGGLGLLTAIAVPILLVLLTLATLFCLSPATFVGALLFAAALIFGWLAFGMLVGAKLSAALRLYNLSPAVSAALGTFVFTLVTRFLAQVPCVGWIVPAVLACIGLGAVTLTRFGTRPYLSHLPVQPTPPPSAPDAGHITAP